MSYQFTVFLYTDNIDIIVMNSSSKSIEEIVACAQFLTLY